MAPDGVTLVVGTGFTVTTTVAVELQPVDSEPVTVYVCVVAGLAVTAMPVVKLRPVAGAHVYNVAVPLAVKPTEPPLHNVVEPDGVTLVVGTGFTVTATVFTALLHPAEVPVTEYVIVLAGLALIEDPVVALRAVFGDQLYVVAPLQFNAVELPAQIVDKMAVAVTVGVGFTVTTTVAVALQPLATEPVTVYV